MCMKNDNLWKNGKSENSKFTLRMKLLRYQGKRVFSGQKLFFSRPLLNFPSLALNPYENKGP